GRPDRSSIAPHSYRLSPAREGNSAAGAAELGEVPATFGQRAPTARALPPAETLLDRCRSTLGSSGSSLDPSDDDLAERVDPGGPAGLDDERRVVLLDDARPRHRHLHGLESTIVDGQVDRAARVPEVRLAALLQRALPRRALPLLE